MTYALLIYRLASEAREKLDEASALERHRALQAEARARGELHAVARLDDAARARTVRRTAGAHQITDGPYVETKEWLVGFYLIDCASEDEAVARAQGLCGDEHHAIEVRPVAWKHPE